MTTIGGAGGPGSTGGPGGPSGLGGPGSVSGSISGSIDDLEATDAPHGAQRAGGAPDVADVTRGGEVAHTQGTAAASELERLSAELAAGRLTPREVVDHLVDATAGPGLGAAERAELRELLTDLVANDPYLGGLIGRI